MLRNLINQAIPIESALAKARDEVYSAEHAVKSIRYEIGQEVLRACGLSVRKYQPNTPEGRTIARLGEVYARTHMFLALDDLVVQD